MSTALPALSIETALRIAKPVAEVFEAIVDPENMANYFIAKGSSRMQEGSTVYWSFPEMEMKFPVQVKKIIIHQLIEFSWQDMERTDTTVRIILTPVTDTITFVTVTEGEKEPTEKGIAWLKGNTAGWANFLACLKAYLEYGINLRKGAFDPSQMPADGNTATNSK